VIAELSETTENSRWQAVIERDPAATFVYAVRSTGIYCRPACASRKPNPNQVLFFPVPDAAEEAGFRPCKRCRPDEAGSADAGVELAAQACRAIEAEPDRAWTLAALGKAMGVSPYHLQRTFKRVMGVTPRQYADTLRMERFKEGLKSGEPVTEALFCAGFGSTSRLYERAASQLGMVPARYRRGGAGMTVHFATASCPLGRLLVAATERGICFVSLGESDAELERALAQDLFAARIERDDTTLRAWVEAIVRYLEGQAPHLDLPVDIQATAFQRRVWEELRAIPYGETRTYGEIARAIGHPAAARAVGRACATNPVSLVIPCHRAVGSDGNVTGYRWGKERKRALLITESGRVGLRD